MSARDFFFRFFKLVSSKRFSKGILDGMRRPKRKIFCVVAKREKAIRHIEKTKHKGTAFKTIKSLMILLLNFN